MGDHSSVEKKPFLGSALYDFLKQSSLVYLPAVSAAYFALDKVWGGLPYVEQVIGTIAVIEIFLGAVLGFSKAQYNKSGAAYSGSIDVNQTEDETTARVQIDKTAEELAGKDSVTLKVNSQ